MEKIYVDRPYPKINLHLPPVLKLLVSSLTEGTSLDEVGFDANKKSKF
jgi:hypothetical protein